jgi:hypothetical protein
LHKKSLGCRWMFSVRLILMCVGLVTQVLFLPERIYIRNSPDTPASSSTDSPPPAKPTLLGLYGVHMPKRHQDAEHSFWFVFARPFAFRFPAAPGLTQQRQVHKHVMLFPIRVWSSCAYSGPPPLELYYTRSHTQGPSIERMSLHTGIP